jgi:hypothetical protein
MASLAPYREFFYNAPCWRRFGKASPKHRRSKGVRFKNATGGNRYSTEFEIDHQTIYRNIHMLINSL